MLDIFYSKSDDGKTAQNLVFEYCHKNLEDVIQQHKKKYKELLEKGIPAENADSNLVDLGARIPIEEIKSFMKQIL